MREANAKRRVGSSSPPPSLKWERRAWQAGKSIVAGVDEAGRGAWAGPLVAAAVVLPSDPNGRRRLTQMLRRVNCAIHDSKLLSAEHRSRVMDIVYAVGIPFAVSVVDVDHLDAIGLGVANRLAMCDAVGSLNPAPEHVLVDAFRLPDLPCTHDPIIHGDALSQTIALASIVAKVHRDAIMVDLDSEYPVFGFGTHKGYGTAAHRLALDHHGITPHHRKSFAPIAEYLASVADD